MQDGGAGHRGGRAQVAGPGRPIHPVQVGDGGLCVAPWVSLEFDPAGWVYACCASQLYPLGRIGVDRLPDLWDGPRASVLKAALARRDLSVACMSCRWHLEHGRTDTDAAVYDQYPTRGSEHGPKSMTIALSHRCNLGCVMCSPELSSTLRHRAGMAPMPARYGDEFFSDLEPFLDGLVYAKFLGGEPFLIEEHHRVWDLMIAAGAPQRMQVTTNGTIWNDRVERVLDSFRTDVTVSVDAVEPARYEMIRDGARHSAVLANVERFRRHCADAGTELRLCFCLMQDNWMELAPFLRWAEELGAAVTINVVSDTGLALHDLPTAELGEVRRRWLDDDRTFAAGFVRTSSAWRTQLEQLDLVLDERARGITASPRQPTPTELTGTGWADLHSLEPQSDDRCTREAAALADWSTGGVVARVRVDDAARITGIDGELGHLGLTTSITGRGLDELDGILHAADGRHCYLLDLTELAGVRIRTVVLSSATPQRGSAGTVVRTVLVRRGDGAVLLAAEDRTFEPLPGAAEPASTVQVRIDRG